MHFALPPRKTSHPPPYARAAARSTSNRRRAQLQIAGLALFAISAFFFILRAYLRADSYGTSSVKEDAVDVKPEIVIVTILDEKAMTEDHIRKIKANRDDYAARHGYTNFYTNFTTYQYMFITEPISWALVPALRHALTLHPTCTHVFSLTANALITNPSLSLESHILNPDRLPGLMIKDIPVVPPDSVIHTFSHLTPSKVDLILSQDMGNLAHTSLLLRNSEWARYFLDAWIDPLYRSYNFQKAEGHALEHIVQWHPTILARLVLIPQRLMNSYNYATSPEIDSETNTVREVDSMWQEGDLLINFKGCDETMERNCEQELAEYYEKWEQEVRKLGNQKPKSSRQEAGKLQKQAKEKKGSHN